MFSLVAQPAFLCTHFWARCPMLVPYRWWLSAIEY